MIGREPLEGRKEASEALFHSSRVNGEPPPMLYLASVTLLGLHFSIISRDPPIQSTNGNVNRMAQLFSRKIQAG